MDQKHLNKRKNMSMVKRIGITIACCFPFIIAVGLLLNGKISNFAMILIFTAILLVVVVIEELFYAAKEQQQDDKKKRKDVFK